MTMNGPLSEAIGLAVLHLLWQGVLVAAVLAVALRLLARSSANLRYGLSCAALAALVTLGVVTAYRSYEPAMAAAANVPIADTSLVEASSLDPAEPGMVAQLAMFVDVHSSTIAFLWLLGVVTLAARLAVSWSRTRGLLTEPATPAPQEWQEVTAHLCDMLKVTRAVRLIESAAVDVPSVIGFLKPVVLVPASSLSGLSTRQLEMILAHELAHIRRHDFLVNMLQSVADTLLFYNPSAWWISRQIRVERENCCDDLAVSTCGNAVEYARALTVLEELRETPALAVAANGGSLLDRVKRLIGIREKTMVNGWTAVAAAISFAVVMMVTSLPLQADRSTPPDAPPAPAAPPAPPAPPASDAAMDVLADVPPPPPAPEAPEAPDAPWPAPAKIAVDHGYDYDFDLAPVIAPTPAIAPRPSVRPFRAPRAAIAPHAPLAIAAADFDFDDDDDDPADDKPIGSGGRLTVDELISLSIHKVTPQYIQEMRVVFSGLTLRQAQQMKMMNVTPKYVADMRAAGVDITTPKEATSLKIHNVTPEFVRSLSAAGYTKLTVRDLTRLAIAGVNADFIREMSQYRDKK